MQHSRPQARRDVVIALTCAIATCCASRCTAISVGQLDDFQDGTSQDWGILAGTVPVANAADAGPSGIGDHALFMDTAVHGAGRMVVINAAQWAGDWTAAGITHVSMDVRNPNAFNLTLRLGIAGPGGVFVGGGGDSHVTDGIPVPADNQWHSISFSVLAEDFTALGGADTAAALADVTHVRILNNANLAFVGDFGGSLYLDNILALGAASTLPGDYNGDGVVDAADYVIWRKMDGLTVAPGTGADGTGPGGQPDGIVDQLDYLLWREQFGNMQSGHNHGFGAATAVPEPTSLLLLIAALACSRCLPTGLPRQGAR